MRADRNGFPDRDKAVELAGFDTQGSAHSSNAALYKRETIPAWPRAVVLRRTSSRRASLNNFRSTAMNTTLT